MPAWKQQSYTSNKMVLPIKSHFQQRRKGRFQTIKSNRSRSYWVCGTIAYRELPINWIGTCYPSWILPPTGVMSQLPQGRIRNYQMIYATGRARRRDAYEPWRSAVIESTREISEAILKLSEEVQQIRNISLQNRLALDLILLAQGGTCALIQQRCCV